MSYFHSLINVGVFDTMWLFPEKLNNIFLPYNRQTDEER